MKGHLVIICSFQIAFFLTFVFFRVPFLVFFALVFGLNLTNAALKATGEGMTGYITKKKRLLDSLLKKKRQILSRHFDEKSEDLEKGMTDNEDAVDWELSHPSRGHSESRQVLWECCYCLHRLGMG